jgi:hypothetical protein
MDLRLGAISLPLRCPAESEMMPIGDWLGSVSLPGQPPVARETDESIGSSEYGRAI